MLKFQSKYILILFLLLTQIGNAQFYFFGRNKVQYEKFDWKVLKTEHFNIYYYGEFEGLAEIGANYAEEAFDELKVKFNHIVVTRIPLIFYNTHIHFQQTNTISGFIPEGVGGFFEFLKGRVVIPYLSSLDQFRHVIRHELVHVFMTSKVINDFKDHRVIADRYPPLWFVEGLAEYWSTDWDTQAEMVMRDAVLNDIFVPLSEISRIYGSFLMYKEGQSFLEFAEVEYGEDKVLQILENMWRFSSFKDIIEFTLEEDLKTIDGKWLYWLRQKYFPLYKDKFPHHIKAKKITDFGFNFNPNVYVNDDNEKEIYFVSNRTGYSSVYKLKYDHNAREIKDPEIIIEGETQSEFEAFHLFQSSINVSKQGMMAFVTKSEGTDVLHLYSIVGEEMIKTFEWNNLITIRGPKFSDDGKKIVFNATDQKGFSDIFILDLDSENITRLTNDIYADKDPVFNKDATAVIFCSDRSEAPFKEKYNLFNLDIGESKLEYLTYVDADISTPHFNPDYTELYFNSDYDGTNNIWKLTEGENGSMGMEQKTFFATSVFDFAFVSEDTLVTSAFENFSFQFYSLPLNEAPDSLKKYVAFDFDLIDKKWVPESIVLDSEQDRLVYENEYTLDYAVSQLSTDPVYGTRGGALFTLSDLLGDDRFLFLVYNTAEVQSEILKNFNVAITRVNYSERTNFGYGIFHFAGRRYDLRESDQFFYERSFGGFFSLHYPFSSFQRLEASVTLANSDKEDADVAFFNRKALLLTNSISFVHDNSLWGPTGPIDGSRFRFLLGYTSDIKYSNVNYLSMIFDYRKYLRLGYRTALAARASVYVNHGKEARRYFAGGSWDLRGWPRWSVRGEKLWISSIELRYPFIDQLAIRFPFFGIGFASIRGALFFDAGSAWDDEYEETIGSIGTGIRINFFNVITFRYDVGKKIENDFTNLQPKLFYQFFFGWDF